MEKPRFSKPEFSSYLGSFNFLNKDTEVIFVKDLLFAVLALISAIVAVVTFLRYQSTADTTMIVIAVICIIGTLGFGAAFLSGRVNKQEDIHITE